MNWNYLLVGAGAVAVIGGVVAMYLNRQGNLNFEEYCLRCKSTASNEITNSDEIVKTILVLTMIENNKIAPFLYRSYKNGRIVKKRIKYKSFPFSNCPDYAKDAIVKGEYIIERY